MSRWLTPKKFVSFAARLRFCSNIEISGGLVMLHSERNEIIDGQGGSERLRSLRVVPVGEEGADGISGSLES